MSRNVPGHPHGEQVVKVRLDEIRALGFMPRDVEVVGLITPPEQQWVPREERFIFLHIRSTVSPTRPEGSPLTIDGLLSFYDTYISLRQKWVSDLGLAMSVYQGG
jgi:hypothetical protein